MDLLEQARQKINEIDEQMAELFVERMRASELVAEYKRQHGLPVQDEVREAMVLQRNSTRVKNDDLRAYYVNFIKNNMALSRAYQQKILEGMRVAYSGVEGAFAHIATGKLFPSAKKMAYPSFADAYEAVERGDCDVAVLPVENSYNGEVGQVTDLMFSGSLYVNAMLDLAVTQDLLTLPGASMADIRTVVSHPQALGQCAEYIRRHGWDTREYANTALAAKYVSEIGDASVAAIPSAEAAELFGLAVAERNINESRNNTTRFAVFSRSQNRHLTGRMGLHSILVFTVRNEAGALARAMDVIGRHGFNLRTLRSRPMKELLWQYYFYVETDGDIDSAEGTQMLSELAAYCDRLRLVGTYANVAHG